MTLNFTLLPDLFSFTGELILLGSRKFKKWRGIFHLNELGVALWLLLKELKQALSCQASTWSNCIETAQCQNYLKAVFL